MNPEQVKKFAPQIWEKLIRMQYRRDSIVNLPELVKDVVKKKQLETIYVTDMSTYGTVNEIYRSYFSDPYPARETVCIKELPLGAKVEISMIAVLG